MMSFLRSAMPFFTSKKSHFAANHSAICGKSLCNLNVAIKNFGHYFKNSGQNFKNNGQNLFSWTFHWGAILMAQSYEISHFIAGTDTGTSTVPQETTVAKRD